MDSQSIDFPHILPVPEGVCRPFWSVMLPTYNRTKYLEKALKSVLEQDQGPAEMQIEVIDNCSTEGNVEEVIEKVGKGRVSFHRQSENIGMIPNFNACVARAKGRWVHIMHDDDMVLPGFYARYRQFIQERPEVRLIFCRAIAIDGNGQWLEIRHSPPHWREDGIVPDAAVELAKNNFIVAPTAVVSRDAYSRLGGFGPQISSADWIMWMRVAAAAPIGYIHQPLFLYRIHDGRDSHGLLASSRFMDDSVYAAEVNARLLPPAVANEVRRAAHRNYSNTARRQRRVLHSRQEHRVALQYAKWAFRLHPSWLTLKELTGSLLRLLKAKCQRKFRL